MVLYLEDYQFVDPSILECINSLLSSGEVPGLFGHDELESIAAPLKEKMSEVGGCASRGSTLMCATWFMNSPHRIARYRTAAEFFYARVRANLHIVLGMDDTNDLFRVRYGRGVENYWRLCCLAGVSPIRRCTRVALCYGLESGAVRP